ncbi:ricin-type beta-trefoil lectin domain protein [Streptomyces sp. WG7]|uniref:ricin-type beta-trefoil lectin domain protein n=1 Tax=Streptomyces sp. WG7 TaxID=3417650 RepID=UPI003CF2FFC0
MRQAVALPAVAGNLDEQLGRLKAWRRGSEGATASDSRAGTGATDTAAANQEETSSEEGGEPERRTRTASRIGGWRRLTRADSAEPSSGADEAVASAEAPAATTGGTRVDTTAFSGSAADATAVGSPQPPRATGDTDGQNDFGRPKKPMLAAAALAGVVLITVPLLLAGMGDDERKESTTGASGDTLLAGESGASGEVGNFMAQPSPDEAASAGKSSVDKSASKEPGADRPKSGQQGAATGPNGLTETDSLTGKGGSADDTGAVNGAPGRSNPKGAESQRKGSQNETRTTGNGTSRLRSESIRVWEKGSHQLTNQHTGKCLAHQASRTVVQGSCGGARWQRYSVTSDTWLLKHVGANRCLDTDGRKLYLSSCTVKDAGQVWRLPSADCTVNVISKAYGTYVTGWDGGAASAVTRDRVDKPAKYRWRAPQLSGC